MPRVLLLVPSATYRAADFIDAAAALGVEVVVATEQAHALAGLMGARSLELPLDDPERAARIVVAHDEGTPIDAVVAVDDQGTVVAAEAARRLGLRHNRPEAVRDTRDKLRMRTVLALSEVPQPAFAPLEAGAGARELRAALAAVGLPCVVKPTTLSGSQGVLRADDEAQAAAAVARVRAIAASAGADPQSPLIVERYVAGAEVAVEAMLRQGDLEVLALFDKPDPLEGPAFEETLYVTPSRLDPADQRAVVAAVRQAVRALGLEEGPVHAEVRVATGRAWVIEVAARTIGGLCARTLSFGTGRSLEQLVLAHALGLPGAGPARNEGASGVLMIPIPRSGVLRAVLGREQASAVEGITGIEITAVVGRPIAPPPEGSRYLGFVFARCTSPHAVERALRAAGDALQVDVEEGPVSTADAPAPC